MDKNKRNLWWCIPTNLWWCYHRNLWRYGL